MTGRHAARILLAGGVLVGLLAAGCGVRPSKVITGLSAPGGPLEGAALYLIWHGDLALVLRPAQRNLPPAETLRLLAAGPDDGERNQGFTSEVPATLVPVVVVAGTTDASGFTVRVSGPVTTLSTIAADQIICTASAAVAATNEENSYEPVAIRGPDGARPPKICPLL